MRFPLSLTRSLAGYLLRKKLGGQAKFPMVLMLEPLHACNLKCTGCGRIREYADTFKLRLSLQQCLDSVEECGAPVVSVCGGEPLIYPEIVPLLEQIIAGGRHAYLCTNGVFLEKKLPELPRSNRLFINVHLDGMEATHDRLVEREGVFATAVAGIRAAKAAGYYVYTNTTVYLQTDMHEIAVLFDYLTELGVDGMMLSPAYGYEAVTADRSEDERLFLSRDEINVKFREAERLLRGHRLTSTPAYLDFLCGRRELPCAAWANPTRNIRGWKGPCYLITDAHYDSYAELIEKTDWQAVGPGRDPRCAHCMTHCGFEPSAVLYGNRGIRDFVRLALWQMG